MFLNGSLPFFKAGGVYDTFLLFEKLCVPCWKGSFALWIPWSMDHVQKTRGCSWIGQATGKYVSNMLLGGCFRLLCCFWLFGSDQAQDDPMHWWDKSRCRLSLGAGDWYRVSGRVFGSWSRSWLVGWLVCWVLLGCFLALPIGLQSREITYLSSRPRRWDTTGARVRGGICGCLGIDILESLGDGEAIESLACWEVDL